MLNRRSHRMPKDFPARPPYYLQREGRSSQIQQNTPGGASLRNRIAFVGSSQAIGTELPDFSARNTSLASGAE